MYDACEKPFDAASFMRKKYIDVMHEQFAKKCDEWIDEGFAVVMNSTETAYFIASRHKKAIFVMGKLEPDLKELKDLVVLDIAGLQNEPKSEEKRVIMIGDQYPELAENKGFISTVAISSRNVKFTFNEIDPIRIPKKLASDIRDDVKGKLSKEICIDTDSRTHELLVITRRQLDKQAEKGTLELGRPFSRLKNVTSWFTWSKPDKEKGDPRAYPFMLTASAVAFALECYEIRMNPNINLAHDYSTIAAAIVKFLSVDALALGTVFLLKPLWLFLIYEWLGYSVPSAILVFARRLFEVRLYSKEFEDRIITQLTDPKYLERLKIVQMRQQQQQLVKSEKLPQTPVEGIEYIRKLRNSRKILGSA